MIKILKYSFFDLVRSKWNYVYLGFYLLIGFGLLFLNNDLSKATITLLNIIVVLTPLIGTLFGIIFHYNSLEFTELLLAQPIPRRTIFLGQYLGLSLSLSLSLVFGLGIPFALYGALYSSFSADFLTLLLAGSILSFIFVALSMLIGLRNTNRIKGFGYAILLWLFLAVIYDGIFMILLVVFHDYPLDSFALVAAMMNPIDLARIMILLKLDISALMGYTGAVLQKFFGTSMGFIVSMLILLAWIGIPMLIIERVVARKDF